MPLVGIVGWPGPLVAIVGWPGPLGMCKGPGHIDPQARLKNTSEQYNPLNKILFRKVSH